MKKALKVGLIALVLLGIGGLITWGLNRNSPDNGKVSLFTDKEVTVVAAGDIACVPEMEPTSTTCRAAKTAELTAGLNPDAVLALGDLQYENGVLGEFFRSYGHSWGKFWSKTYPTPGNHEYSGGDASDYYSYFVGRSGESQNGYYSVNLGNWHIVALNSNCQIVACKAGSGQFEWLKADLAANKSQCTLAFWHHPRYSSGSTHGSNAATQDLWALLADSKAELALSGHEHVYERFTPLDADGNELTSGLRQFVVGTGGRSLYSFRATPLSASQFRDDENFGVLKLLLKKTTYEWEFITENNQVLDSGTGRCTK